MTEYPNGWQTDIDSQGRPHVLPIDDLMPHRTEATCWCSPETDREDGIIVHASADQREKFERGERKAS